MNPTRTAAVLALAVCLCTGALRAEEPDAAEFVERFKLFNECSAFDLVISPLPARAQGIGLTKDAVQATVESRLQAEGLYDADADAHLHVDVSMSGQTFSMDLNFNKSTLDLASGVLATATTWRAGILTTHGGNAESVLASLSQMLNDFLAEFHRVNEDACEADASGRST